MQVFKYKLAGTDQLFHTLAVDRMDAILDICELWSCAESDIVEFGTVERLTAKRPTKVL